MHFENSVSVITGSGSGIGQQIANGLWQEGATVCLVGRDHSRLENAISSGGDDLDRVFCYPADITLDDEVRDLVKRLRAEHERIDILVHSAGVYACGEWESFLLEELDLMYRTNLRAPILLTQALLPALRTCKGQVVFINSSVGNTVRAKVGAYSAMKHGLRVFADSLREEVNSAGIRVISVYPGRTATPMQSLACRLEGQEYTPERFLKPEDVAESVLCAMKISRDAEVTDLHIRPMSKPKGMRTSESNMKKGNRRAR
jgi:NADP-dependent 3-hydroxy acid dehydrogenase YdfG